MNGLGFGGFFGVVNLGSGADEAWAKAFGTGENKRIADELVARHGDGANVRRNMLLAAKYAEDTDAECTVDVARAVLGDSALPPEDSTRFCRNGLAARVLAKQPAALLGIHAIDQFSPRRHYEVTVGGHRLAPPKPLHVVDWFDVAERALAAMGKGRGTLRLRAVVPRAWRKDVVLAFRERGRAAPNWGPDKPYDFQLGYKHEWTWVKFFDGGHSAHVAGYEPERAVEVASELATALWGRERRYTWARHPLTPEKLAELHAALIDPSNPRLRLLEVVGELPGLHDRPTLKLSNTDQQRIERALAGLWSRDVGFAKDPGDVLRVKASFEHGKRKYRIEVHYPEDALAEELVLGVSTVGVKPDVVDAFTRLVKDEFGINLHPRSPGDVGVRSASRSERPSPMLARHFEHLLGPSVLSPAKWETKELEALATKGVLTLQRQAVFRCGSPAIIHRVRNAPDGCTGWVVGEYGAADPADPLVQGPGDSVVCDRCGAHWPRRKEGLPWKERVLVALDAEAAWRYVVKEVLAPKISIGDRSRPGVFGWYADGFAHEVVSTAVAPAERRELSSGAGRATAWFACSEAEAASYGERGVSFADVLARDLAAFERVHQLGPIPLPTAAYVASPAGPTYTPGRSRPNATALREVVLQRGDDGGAYLLDQPVVKPSERTLLLVIAALQDWTDDQDEPPDERTFVGADEITSTIVRNLAALGGGLLPERRRVKEAKVYEWVMRVRDRIDEARIVGAAGDAVIERGGKKGIRVGPRFRIVGFSIRDEVRRYKESATGAKDGSKT